MSNLSIGNKVLMGFGGAALIGGVATALVAVALFGGHSWVVLAGAGTAAGGLAALVTATLVNKVYQMSCKSCIDQLYDEHEQSRKEDFEISDTGNGWSGPIRFEILKRV